MQNVFVLISTIQLKILSYERYEVIPNTPLMQKRIHKHTCEIVFQNLGHIGRMTM